MGAKKREGTGIGFLLADISRLLRQDFDRRVRDLGMNQAQWRALAHLARDEGMYKAALAERLEHMKANLNATATEANKPMPASS